MSRWVAGSVARDRHEWLLARPRDSLGFAAMGALVLESSLGSQYEDSPTSYEFPAQYLKYFIQAAADPPVFAVLYEPRGNDGRGRMRYVGLAEIAGPPSRSGRTSDTGRPLYIARYKDPAMLFEVPVPREILGEPIEGWLGRYQRGRARNVAAFGRAVRPLDLRDFQRILELGGAATLSGTQYPLLDDYEAPTIAARERTEVLVSLLKRSADFSQRVISAYGEKCAVSGFELGRVPITRAVGLLDAAHIRPISFDGPDEISNGLPLTPTLHRLFDAGLFTIAYRDGRPEVRVSPQLEPRMVVSDDPGFRLSLANGVQIRLAGDRRAWPNHDQVTFHQNRVFRASA